MPHMASGQANPLAGSPFVGDEDVDLVSIPRPPHLLLETRPETPLRTITDSKPSLEEKVHCLQEGVFLT